MAGWWPSALERRIALRYLRGQRGTRSASLQTSIAIGGFAVGVTALILVLGVMNGLSTDLRDKILVLAPHLRVLASGPAMRLEQWPAIQKQLQHAPEIISVAPEVSSRTIIENTAEVTEGVFVMGLEPGNGTDSVTSLQKHILTGDLTFKRSSSTFDVAVVLGNRLASELGVVVGDTVIIVPPTMLRLAAGGHPQGRAWRAEVRGTFETGMYLYDNNTIVMSRTDAQEFAGLDSAVTDLAVSVHDAWRAPVIAAQIDSLLGLQYRTETWQELNGGLFSALALEKLAMGLVIFIIMVVAAFNIVGTLTMVVAFKTREIGILLAMGLRRDGIRRIFMLQGTTIGLVGTTIGVVLGLSLSWIIDGSGLIKIDETIYFISTLPVRVQPLDVLAVVTASLLAALLATILPSRRAAALAPVEAIRAE